MSETKKVIRSNDLIKILSTNKWKDIVAPYIYILATIVLLFTCSQLLKFNYQIVLYKLSFHGINTSTNNDDSNSLIRIDSQIEKKNIKLLNELSHNQLELKLINKSNKNVTIPLTISQIKISEIDNKISLTTKFPLSIISKGYEEPKKISICLRLTLWDYFLIN